MRSDALAHLRFEGLTLNLARLSLEGEGGEIFLRPKSFKVLRYLAENPGRLVGKDELIETVWSGASVTDDSLVQCIKDIRAAIGDRQHRIIRTLPRRGYLFAALVTESPAPAVPTGSPSAVRYARSGDVHIAYQMWGEGPGHLVLCPGFVTHIENLWTEPGLARFMRRMGRFARVVMFDKRGTGMSDRVDSLPGMDERVDDVRAVMDAEGVERAAVIGPSEGGSLATYFAATHPQRCEALVLYGAFANFASWIPTEEALRQLLHYIDTGWGSGASLPMFSPSMAGNAEFRNWWARFERLGASPAAAMALMRMNSRIDITEILPTIRVPTLVVHRTGDVTVDVEAGRLLSARIPNARLVEIPGADHLFWVGENSDEILRSIEAFLASPKAAPEPDRVLATVLAMEIVEAAAGPGRSNGRRRQNADPDNIVRRELARFRGRRVEPPGSGLLAIFDGPSRAIQGAFAVKAALGRLGAGARFGIHIGELDIFGTRVRGVATDIAAGIARHGGPGDVLVSRTLKDLVAGADFTFQSLGPHALENVRESWELYRATV